MSPPKRLHIDRRASAIAAFSDGDNDDLMSTREVAAWFGVSTQWLETARSENYGPPYIRLAPQVLRYRRSDLLGWLKEREYSNTAHYVSPDRRLRSKKAG